MNFSQIIILALSPFCIVFMVVFLFFMSGDYNEKSIKMLCFFGSNTACNAVVRYGEVYEMQNNIQMANNFYKFACKHGKICDKQN